MAARLLFTLFFLCAAARAQDEPAPGAPPPDAPAAQEAPLEAAYPASMNIDDARMNFVTVVESFITARSPKGSWPLKQKTSAKVLHLRFEKALPKTVRKTGGGDVYIGRVVLWEVAENFAVQADFTVDLSGRRWQVKSMRLVGKPAAPAPAAKP